MCGNHHRLAGKDLRADHVNVVRGEALHHVLEALGARHFLQKRVARVIGLRVLVVRVNSRWRGVVGAAPRHELLFAELVADLRLVQALQLAVVTLIETPVAHHRNPVAIRRVQRNVCGADCAAQQGGEHNVRQDILFHHELAGVDCLALALLGQVNVYPTGELIRLVPFALAVTDQDQLSVTHAFKHATL